MGLGVIMLLGALLACGFIVWSLVRPAPWALAAGALTLGLMELIKAILGIVK